MTENNTETTEVVDTESTTTEGDIPDAPPEGNDESVSTDEPETFPREVVEKLRQENGRYRQRAQQADTLAERLHTELVRATGRLADPTDLPYSEDHLDDPEKMTAALDELLDRKPHLATRRPSGDIGQGNRGPASSGFSLLDTLKSLT